MIIGRHQELSFLENTLLDDKSHFIAVYGRRRIGKTFLIREAFNYRFSFEHAGLSEGSLKEQLYAFSTSIREASGTPAPDMHNWLEAFEQLKELVRQSSEKKKVLFIDELSWMDTRNSDLLPALEHFWNGWASARKDIVLIVCASATSWMLSKIVHNKGGLYNRLTAQIHLKPFTLGECEEYIKSVGLIFHRDQILQYYMIAGGVPYYWGFLQKGLSLAQNIDHIFFEQNAPLKDEFRYLYASVFRNPTVHIKLIQALAQKKVGMTRDELIQATGLVNSGDLTAKLNELESCGFIRKYNAYGMRRKNAVYQLIDSYTLFYYRFLIDEPTDNQFWTHQINTPAINTWTGLAFERVCLLHIDQIKQKLGISGVHADVNSWYCDTDPDKGIFGSQIDLLIVRKDQVINLCEIKYSGTEYAITAKTDHAIRQHISDLVTATKTRYVIYPTLITCYGLLQNSYSDAIASVITLDDLF